jgi:RecB family endonuclease NucS
MSIQMQLWSIEADRPVRLPSAKLDLEARLERWICQDLSLVGEDLLFLGSQVATAYGHAIDILALDRQGNLVILELKRGRAPRDVVAQVLDYASWVHGLSAAEVESLATAHRQKPLEDLYREVFHADPPDTLNEEQRLIIVAT